MNSVGTSEAWSHRHHACSEGGLAPHAPASIAAWTWAVSSQAAGSLLPDDISDHGVPASSELDRSFFCWAGLGGSFSFTFPSGPCQLSLGSINICPYLGVHNEHTTVRWCWGHLSSLFCVHLCGLHSGSVHHFGGVILNPHTVLVPLLLSASLPWFCHYFCFLNVTHLFMLFFKIYIYIFKLIN